MELQGHAGEQKPINTEFSYEEDSAAPWEKQTEMLSLENPCLFLLIFSVCSQNILWNYLSSIRAGEMVFTLNLS